MNEKRTFGFLTVQQRLDSTHAARSGFMRTEGEQNELGNVERAVTFAAAYPLRKLHAGKF
jgi:hypothetical protein